MINKVTVMVYHDSELNKYVAVASAVNKNDKTEKFYQIDSDITLVSNGVLTLALEYTKNEDIE